MASACESQLSPSGTVFIQPAFVYSRSSFGAYPCRRAPPKLLSSCFWPRLHFLSYLAGDAGRSNHRRVRPCHARPLPARRALLKLPQIASCRVNRQLIPMVNLRFLFRRHAPKNIRQERFFSILCSDRVIHASLRHAKRCHACRGC
jgi:hypothetical protein